MLCKSFFPRGQVRVSADPFSGKCAQLQSEGTRRGRRAPPSRDDVAMTKAAAAEKLGILLHDNLVVGRKGHKSFRSLGLLS